MGKKSESKNDSNANEEKLNRLKGSIKGTLTREETLTSEKTVSKDTSVTEIEILVDPNQRDLQRMVSKTSADAPVKTYKLSTVTYGKVCAVFSYQDLKGFSR
ncbi:hypothetical protein TNCT_529511 [Trichonephila clavata]|uniref:Uncharacterized protein n=1 Tax=Trichonephila clavata TaxID=2740835 RepID=A0A8X6HQF9_TRICU|nr:hypothetical protein TNCT_529511 [Trichonephila clavata]